MHALIQQLIDRGHAYPALDGSGDVYFDVRSWDKYGSLTRQKVDDMQGAPDADPRGKKDPRDFALWKGHKEGEPTTASWASPWGAGRPGWHLECSAMVTKYLGTEFDIHGGGLDLRFPHHENEMAQSQAAGHGFANFWMHNGMVTYAGEKMSKSIGNTVSPAEMLELAPPRVVRYYLGQAQYRSVLDYQPTSLQEAAAAMERIDGFISRAVRTLASASTAAPPQASDSPATGPSRTPSRPRWTMTSTSRRPWRCSTKPSAPATPPSPPGSSTPPGRHWPASPTCCVSLVSMTPRAGRGRTGQHRPWRPRRSAARGQGAGPRQQGLGRLGRHPRYARRRRRRRRGRPGRRKLEPQARLIRSPFRALNQGPAIPCGRGFNSSQ